MDLKKKKIEMALEELTAKKPKTKTKKAGTTTLVPSLQTIKKTYVKFNYRSLFDVSTTYGKLFLIIISIILSIVVHRIVNNVSLDIFSSIKDFNDLSDMIPKKSIVPPKRKPIYWIYGADDRDGIETNYVHRVLERLGFERGNNRTEWDLLWAHDYVFDQIPKLTPHQKVNHYPGTTFLTNKVSLMATENVYSYIPKTFYLPADQVALLEYARQYPEKWFVQKSKDEPDVSVHLYDDLDLDAEESSVQAFIDNPLLIDGHKFDIGVYVIVTSVNPLRAYMYKGDILLKFCSEKFLPFNAIVSEKYVASKTYLPTWKLPTFSQYNQLLGFGKKDSLSAYISAKDSASNVDILWAGIEDSVRLVLLERESQLLNTATASPQNFFQIFRFDLMVDDKFNVYVLQATMSPIPESEEEETFHEQILYNLLSLAGIGSIVERDSFKNKTRNEEEMISSNKHIAVYPDICSNEPCSESCTSTECQFCLKCLNEETAAILHASYREYLAQGDTKRIFPIQTNDLDEEWLDVLSSKNQMLTKWFYGKCLMDSAWCP